jgi:hypothetical protein
VQYDAKKDFVPVSLINGEIEGRGSAGQGA